MKIIYNVNTGEIDRAISKDQNFNIFLRSYPADKLSQLTDLLCDDVPHPLSEYFVNIATKEIERYPQEVINEKNFYGRILTNEERQLNQLQPSHEEIKKAENTIEILELLSEVL